MTERKCMSCPRELGKKNKSGRCRSCSTAHYNRTPEHRAAVSRGVRKRLEDPVIREKHCRESNARLNAWRQTPEGRASMMRNMDIGRRKGGETKRAWCPQEWRALDDDLRRKNIPLAERKILIKDSMDTAERRRLAAMTPLERQIERLNNGGRLIDKPTYRRADPAYSLVGNATAML